MEEDRPVGLDRLGSLHNTRKESNKGDRARNKNHAWVLADLSSVSEPPYILLSWATRDSTCSWRMSYQNTKR